MKPQLKFFAGLWTLSGYPTAEREWSLPEKFAEIKRQGFDAIGGRFIPEAPDFCAAHGLDYILYLDAGSADFAEQLRSAGTWRPKRINVQLCDHDTPPDEAIRTWLALEKLAGELGLAVDLEVHRDTATETPEKAAALAEAFRAATGRPLRFCHDFSHFAVTKHLAPPFAPRLLARRAEIACAQQFHLRPFNGHHAQIPVTDGRGALTPECRDFLEFVEALLAVLVVRSEPCEVFYVCPENGPRRSGYALSCFPDIWSDTVRLRDEIRARWRGLGGA
ncbi:MAG: xylose isomerase [Opitutaceae bacterium]|nr:xylose isomerase [Opitutaceae bacterium]